MFEVNIEICTGATGYRVIMRTETADGKPHVKEFEAEQESTKTRSELTALLAALRTLNRPCMLTICPPSDYLHGPMVAGWLKKWQENDWKNVKGKTIRNADLWKQIQKEMSRHSVRYIFPGTGGKR